MTERIRQLTVLLDGDYRDEEEGVDLIIKAIEMIKCVDKVVKGNVVNGNDHSAREEFKSKIGSPIAELANGSDVNFLADVIAAYARLKAKRGY
jgi:hypothetical protein